MDHYALDMTLLLIPSHTLVRSRVMVGWRIRHHMTMYYTHIWSYDHVLYPYMAIWPYIIPTYGHMTMYYIWVEDSRMDYMPGVKLMQGNGRQYEAFF